MYFCASGLGKNCDLYRTKDILDVPYEKLTGAFPFWNSNLFVGCLQSLVAQLRVSFISVLLFSSHLSLEPALSVPPH